MSFGWLYISKKITENCNSVGAGTHKVGQVVFDSTVTLILLIFGERKKDKLHILKKVGLRTFKGRYSKNMYIIAQ